MAVYKSKQLSENQRGPSIKRQIPLDGKKYRQIL